MEQNEAPPRRSVAELAGRFRGAAPEPSGGVKQADKAVRRRPPRTLQLPTAEQAQPPSGAASPPKARRNSALIEKLQANLTLVSPTAAPLKSPGLKMLPLGFVPPVPMVTTPSTPTPTSPAPTSPSTESPTSFEAPPSAADGNILQSINKGRARVSIRRRPPSRRHRKSSSGDDVGAGHDGTDTHLSCGGEGQETGTSGGGGGGEVFMEEGPTEASTPPERKETHEEEETKSSTDVKEKQEEEEEKEEEEKEEEEMEEEENVCEDKQQNAAADETKQEEEAKSSSR